MGSHDSGGTAAILVAAGSGVRMGEPVPKALVPLAGRPLLAWSLAALAASAEVDTIVVAAPADRVSDVEAVVRAEGGAGAVVAGGASRAESVAGGLEAIPAGSGIVLVHDAARPLLTPAIVAAVVAGLDDADGAIAARPVADTLKRSDGRAIPVIAGTVNRAPLWAAETPQAFWSHVLRDAVARARDESRLAAATDCASLVEAIGGRVRLVPTPGPNLKITTRSDLALAERLLLDGG